jgi:hypothetical protein
MVYNPWKESLENCIDGSNYLRAGEYLQLIKELDHYYELQQEVVVLKNALFKACGDDAEMVQAHINSQKE